MALTTAQVQTELDKNKARWRSKDTPQSLLTEENQKKLLGHIIDKELVKSDQLRMKAIEAAVLDFAFAPAVDWRNKNGNFVTPVKDQGGCGSCVSFASVGLVESMALIEKGVQLDLSEADSHFCSSHGANCSGWNPSACLDQIISRGVCDESCFPYASAFTPTLACRSCADRNNRAVKVANKNAYLTNNARKNYLTTTGPLTACFAVYNDFFSYGSGVYHHVTGALAGYHCVLVIGYSEVEQCWICKNSWGPGWGSGGFFKIGYGECQIEDNSVSAFYGATGVAITGTGWQSLRGTIIGKPSLGQNKDGRLEVFARGSNNAMWHIWQTAPNNGWSGWASLGGVITTDPVVISNADGRLEAFAKGQDNALWHIWQTAPNNGWSAWASLGGVITSNPAVGKNKDGRIEVFARGADSKLWHIWQTAPNNGWSGWASMGVVMTSDPAVEQNADGRLEVFYRGTNNAINHIWQTAPNNGWSSWSTLGGVATSAPFVTRNKDGRLEVFVKGTDNALWHIWQTAPNNGWAAGWASLGGVITSNPTVSKNKDGRIEVFAKGQDNALWHIWQTAPNNGWSGWSSLGGGILGDSAAGTNLDGRLEAFVRGLDSALWHRWQTAAGNGWN